MIPFWQLSRALAEARATIESQAITISKLIADHERRISEAETRIRDLCDARDWASRAIHSMSTADHSFRRQQEVHAAQLRELRVRVERSEEQS